MTMELTFENFYIAVWIDRRCRHSRKSDRYSTYHTKWYSTYFWEFHIAGLIDRRCRHSQKTLSKVSSLLNLLHKMIQQPDFWGSKVCSDFWSTADVDILRCPLATQRTIQNDTQLTIQNETQLTIPNDTQLIIQNDTQLTILNDHRADFWEFKSELWFSRWLESCLIGCG